MRVITLILGALIILSIFISGCIFEKTNENRDSNTKENLYEYFVNITTKSDVSYEIIVPIMITPLTAENNGNVSIIMNTLTTHGNASLEIIETQYGKGLKVNGNGNVLIESKGNENVPFAKLSMLNDSDNDGSVADEDGDVEYWVYINSTNILEIVCIEVGGSVSHGTLSSTSFLRINEIENNGWMRIGGTHVVGAE